MTRALLEKHLTKGGIVSAYKTLDECADELSRLEVRRKIDTMSVDLSKKRAAAQAKEKAKREQAKLSELRSTVSELGDDIERLSQHKENALLVRDLRRAVGDRGAPAGRAGAAGGARRFRNERCHQRG